jgi:hypothetical protein
MSERVREREREREREVKTIIVRNDRGMKSENRSLIDVPAPRVMLLLNGKDNRRVRPPNALI